MRIYKLIDFRMQVFLIGGCFFWTLYDNSFILNSYFIVGSWQLLSCLVHVILNEQYIQARDRKPYLKTLLWVFILAIVTLPLWLFYGFALLFISPGLAIWYASICYTENRILKHKLLIHLKD